VRFISRSKALAELKQIKDDLRSNVESNYEHRAKSCATCETPGACCLDVHFVNVRISRLEAVAIREVLDILDPSHREVVDRRINETRMVGDKFACPLYEPKLGCLVHDKAKPLACIAHACYENKEDLPPDHLLTEQEARVEDLNIKTYGNSQPWLPIPLAIKSI
jgi:hypothetical protein